MSILKLTPSCKDYLWGGNHFPRLHNGLVGGGAVFIRLSEPFAAGAGIDHLIQGNTA